MLPTPKYKLLLFFKRNPSLTPAEFRTYYEANHVPMVMSLANGVKGLLRYIRRYLDHEASNPALGNPFTVFCTPAPVIDFDIVNEVTFASKADAQEFAERLYGILDEDGKGVLVRDEEKLFIREGMRGIIVEEAVSIK